MTYTETRVAWDEEVAIFPAVADLTQRWNGWVAAPFFDREAVDRIIAASDDPEADVFHWEGDTLVQHRTQYEAYGEPDERIEPTLIEGVKRWCVGGFSWTWYEVEPEGLLTFEDAEAIGLDATGRDGDPRFPYTEANLTPAERGLLAAHRTGDLIFCDAGEHLINSASMPYILIAEGGSVPERRVCYDCMHRVESPAEWDRLRDLATMAVGHNCLDYVATIHGQPCCDLCGVVLERAGDALVVPQA